MQARVLNLNALITENEPMLRFAAGKRIEVVTELAPELALASVDPGQMQQVLLNLTLNARDAMKQVGKLTIRTRNVEIDDAQKWPGVPPGSYVLLEVIDTGCGMPEDIRSRVFEPFFTTKLSGKGTGLGLSIVYGIVTQTKGYISVESAPGEGAKFEILLPVAQPRS
jgi:signal transduction histidine kinase